VKSLFDIQHKVHDLEKSINNISIALNEINEDINSLQNKEKETEIDYETINKLSANISFNNHPLKNVESGYVCRIYLEILLSIVRIDLDSESTMDRFVFIQWMLNQANIDMTLEEAFVDCYRMEKDLYKVFIAEVPKTLYETLIVDALIVANIGGTANQEVLEYTAHLCGLLKITKERLYCLSLIAKITLCHGVGADEEIEINDADCIMREARRYRHYVEEITQSILERCRNIIVEMPMSSNIIDFKWKVENGEKIEKGEIIASFKKQNIKHPVAVTYHYESPVEGSIFRFTFNDVYYGVISSYYDDLESIKEWVKKGGK